MGERSRPLRVRRGRTTVGVVVLAVGLAGCVSPPAPSGLDEGTGSRPFLEQETTWHDCGDGLECSEIAAPLDWDDPGGGEIELAVIRRPASSGDPSGVLFMNPGGPGASGIDMVEAGGRMTRGVAESYDVVGWDPRGVGASAAPDCLGDDELDAFLFGTFDSPYGSEQWLAELESEAAAFAAGCERDAGALLAHLDTVSTAKDLELLRVLLADGQLNYLGFSYGTLIGATYAELFPEHVGRMVLDGALDPSLAPFEMLAQQYAAFESALTAYVTDCLEAPYCPFTGTVDESLRAIGALIGGVDGRDLVGIDGRELDSASVATGTAAALYSPWAWPALSQAFAALQDDDPEVFLALADTYVHRSPDGSYPGDFIEAYFMISCVDSDFAADEASPLDRLAEIAERAPVLGRYFSYDDYAPLDAVCSRWPAAPADRPPAYDAVGAPPILVIGTTNDPATPYTWAEALASQLSSGVLVTLEGEGHTAYGLRIPCIDTLVDAYLLDGTVPQEDPHCRGPA